MNLKLSLKYKHVCGMLYTIITQAEADIGLRRNLEIY
jgi:hypothetical protein